MDLLDHFICAAEQRGRHRDAKRFRGPEVDDQIYLRCLLDRHISRLFALEVFGLCKHRLAATPQENSFRS